MLLRLHEERKEKSVMSCASQQRQTVTVIGIIIIIETESRSTGQEELGRLLNLHMIYSRSISFHIHSSPNDFNLQ
jgi:hypothetical protein